MKSKTDTIWGISLMTIGVCTLIICFSAGHVPVYVLRLLGIMLLITIPVAAFFTVKFLKLHSKDKESKGQDEGKNENDEN